MVVGGVRVVGAANPSNPQLPRDNAANLHSSMLTLDNQSERDRRARARAHDLQAARDEINRAEGQRLARRLFIAGALILVAAVVCFVVLPGVGLLLPPVVPVVAFVAIATGALLTGHAEGKIGTPPDDSSLAHANPSPDSRDDGCAVGCCPGPRPPRFTR